MKKLSIALIITLLYLTQSCNDNSKKDSVDQANDLNAKKDSTAITQNNSNEDTATVAPTTTPANTTTAVNEDVAKFAVKAANGGMEEVELGKAAEQKGTSKSVKDFGAMMVRDHTKANDELKALASAKNITLPAAVSDDMQKHMDNLNKKTGKDFDKDYIDMMVSDHKDDIDLFENAAKNSKDPEFKSFAAKTLPTLYKHLGAAKAIVKSRP